MLEMDANPDPPLLRRQIDTAGWVLVVILAVAALWRLVFFFEMYASPYAHDLGLDGAVFHASALEVAAGSWSEDEVFFQAPLYPIALGTVYRFLGPSPVAAKLFQILLGIASCWLSYRIALHILDLAVARLRSDLLDGLCSLFLIPSGNEHRQALICQGCRSSLANARRGTGHECGLAHPFPLLNANNCACTRFQVSCRS